MMALEDMRQNPWLLDFVFASLPLDSETSTKYGELSRQKAKEWFLNNNISVIMAGRADDPALPAITIALVECSEAESTLGDVDSRLTESISPRYVKATPTIIAGPFTPKAYDPTTGEVTLPDAMTTDNIFAGQYLRDRGGASFVITSVTGIGKFKIAADSTGDFTGATITPINRDLVAEIESLSMKETYRIGVHVGSEQAYCIYLFSVLLFCLLRYKEKLIEGRGFERTTLRADELKLVMEFAPEIVYNRNISLSGYVRQYWPKNVDVGIEGVNLGTTLDPGIRIISDLNTPSDYLDEAAKQGWGMTGDDYSNLTKDSLG